jgi:pimeloyl-ACP methyl ester carboxylesterase
LRLRFAALFTSFCVVFLMLVSCGRVPQVSQEETKDPVSFKLETANTTATAGSYVEIPIKLNVPTGETVYGMDITFTYDSSILEPLGATANKQLVHLAASEGQGYIAVLNADSSQSIDVVVTAKVLNETASSINFTADLITDDGTKLEEARSGVTAKGADEATDDRLGAQSVSSSLNATSSFTPGQGGKASISEAKTLEAQFVQLKQDPILAQAFQPTEVSTQAVATFPEAKKEWLESELGDLNQNAVVNLGDSLELLHGLIGQKQLSDYQKFTSDLVDDQKLDEADLAALIVKVALLKVQKLLKIPSMSLHSSPLLSITNYGKTNEVRELALATGDTGLLLIGNNGNSTLKVTISGAPAWLSVTPLSTSKKYTTLGYELKLLSNAPAANAQGSEAELTFTETSIRPYQIKKVKIKIVSALTASFTTTPVVGQAPLKVDVDATNTNALATDTYAWEFGESSATQANPNTSTGIKAFHIYSQAGQYTIKLTVQRGSKTAVAEKAVHVLPAQTELPSPWQRIDLSSPSSILPSSSSFDPATNAFTLSAYADANQTVNHFVYQPLAGDGSIVAKVQLAASSSSTAKGGVMLRQNNEATSPFVFVYVQNSKVLVDYLDAATNQVVTLEGGLLSAATEAKYLKLERKGDSVHVYESGDGVTWRQITVITMLLTNPINIGLVIDVTNGLAQVQLDSVLVQAQTEAESNQIIEEEVTPDEVDLTTVSGKFYDTPGRVTEKLVEDGYFGLTFWPSALNEATNLKLTLSTTPETYYPDNADFQSIYPTSGVRVIGPVVTAEFPLDNLDWQIEEDVPLFFLRPAFNRGELDKVNPSDIGMEVRIYRTDGKVVFYSLDYLPELAGDIEFSTLFLQTNLPEEATGTLKVSVQPVDLSRVLPPLENQFNPQNNVPESTQRTFAASDFKIQSEYFAEPTIFEDGGLYKVNVDAGHPASTLPGLFSQHCDGTIETHPSSVMSKVANSVTVAEGKTPLILVHGWMGLPYVKDSLQRGGIINGDRALIKSQYASALCYWEDFISNYIASDAQSGALDILRNHYELYSYSYNSLLPVECNAVGVGCFESNPNNLAKALSNAFGNTKVVILAHSMGGLVSNTYIQEDKDNLVKHLITAATPYMGSTIITCVSANDQRCTDARINYSVITKNKYTNSIAGGIDDNSILAREIIQIQMRRISRYPGSRDLSWQFPGLTVEPDLSDCQDFVSNDDYEDCRREKRLKIQYSLKGRGVGNPFLERINKQPRLDKHTVFYGNGNAPSAGLGIEQSLASLLFGSSQYQNDSVVPLDSACMKATPANTPGDCANSPFDNLIYRPGFTHSSIIEKENFAPITVELLRLANALTNIDDGTPDGNQRVYIGNTDSQESCESQGDAYNKTGICTDGLQEEALLNFTDFDFGGEAPTFEEGKWRRFGEDADGNDRIGDGENNSNQSDLYLDMSDFRRWRDWYLQYSTLNGSAQHPKKDMDGSVSVYPKWADFNGDGFVSLDSKMPVAGLNDANVPTDKQDANGTPELTDLEVLYYSSQLNVNGQQLWRDADYYTLDTIVTAFGGFKALVESGDIEVYPHYWLTKYDGANNTPNIQCVLTHTDDIDLPDFIYKRGKTDKDKDYERHVYTLLDATYTLQAKAFETSDCTGNPLFEAEREFEVKIGSDEFWDPTSTVVDLDDGTLDGNQLRVIGTDSSKSDANEDGIADDLPDNEILKLTDTAFENNDADKDEYLGDGDKFVPITPGTPPQEGSPSIDIADFRRLRDWLLAAQGQGVFEPSGSPKLNTDEGSLALTWGDFNKDGELSNKRSVTGEFSATDPVVWVEGPEERTASGLPLLSDYEVFYNLVQRDGLWQSAYNTLDDTRSLLTSGDIEIYPRNCLNLDGVSKIRSKLNGTPDWHSYESPDVRRIYTLPQGSYEFVVEVYGEHSGKDVLLLTFKRTFDINPGSDALWDPSCPSVEFSLFGKKVEKDDEVVGTIGTGCYLSPIIRSEAEGLGLTGLELWSDVLLSGNFTGKGQREAPTGNLVNYLFENGESKEIHPGTSTIRATLPVDENGDGQADYEVEAKRTFVIEKNVEGCKESVSDRRIDKTDWYEVAKERCDEQLIPGEGCEPLRLARECQYLNDQGQWEYFKNDKGEPTCGGSSGGSLAPEPIAKAYGDPHVLTLDGLRFLTMETGEFVYARSSEPDGIEFQVRQGRSSAPGVAAWATFNRAVAVRMGGHVFEVRIPDGARLGDSLTLLIDGKISDLAPGPYILGEAFVTVMEGGGVNIWTWEKNTTVPRSAKTRVVIDKIAGDIPVTTPNEYLHGLDISFSTPSLGRYKGLFGTPDGNVANDFMLLDGTIATNQTQFVAGWRDSDVVSSLFTYKPGEGPTTFNIPTQPMPTLEFFSNAGNGVSYVQKAKDLLQRLCQVDPETLSKGFVESIAIELGAGRTENNLIASGLCQDQQVEQTRPRTSYSKLEFEGNLTLSNVPEVGVSGASVTITSPTLGNEILCSGYTYSKGYYRCEVTFPTPSENTMVLEYTLLGRGEPIQRTITITTPAADGLQKERQDFVTTLPNVLHLVGTVRDTSGAIVPKARIQVTGPSQLLFEANDAGYYNQYVPLPEGVKTGNLFYQTVTAEGKGYGEISQGFTIADGITEITTDLEINLANKLPTVPPATVTSRTLILRGTVKHAAYPDFPLAGVSVKVSAPRFIEQGACSTVSDTNGNYECRTVLLTDQPFLAVVTAVGAGPEQRQTLDIAASEIPAKGSTLVKTVNLQLNPTLIDLSGTIGSGTETVVEASLELKVKAGNTTLVTQQVVTDAQGRYGARLIVNDKASLSELTLAYKITTATGSLAGTKTLSVQPNVLNTLSQDLEYSRHVLRFTGKVVNEYDPLFGLAGVRVDVLAATGDTVLCSSITDYQSFYRCDYDVFALKPFAVRYITSETNVEAIVTKQVDPAQASINAFFPVAQTLSVQMPTLQLSGTLKNQQGEALAPATVRVTGDVQAETLLDEEGRYSFLFTFTEDKQVTLAVTAEKDRQSVTAQQDIAVAGKVLQSKTLDLIINQTLPGTAKWSVPTKGYVSTLAKSAEGTLYMGASNQVTAVSPDGTLLWNFNASDSVYAITIGEDGTLYIGSNKRIYALRPDGVKQWEVAVEHYVEHLALAADGTLYAGSYNKLLALTPDGRTKWQINIGTGDLVIAQDGTIYTSGGVALNPDGSVRWYAPVYGKLALAGDGTLLVGDGSTVTALNSNGQTLWQKTLVGISGYQDINDLAVGADGQIYVAAWQGLFVLNSDGSQLWQSDKRAFSVLLGNDGLIYTGSDDHVYALNPGGTVNWSYAASYERELALGAGTLYVGDNYSKLNALTTTATALANTPWSKNRRNDGNTNRADYQAVPRRMVGFSGTLTDPNAGELLSNYQVTVRRDTGEFLCSARTDDIAKYTCTAPLETFDSFDAVFDVTGEKAQRMAVVRQQVSSGVANTTLAVTQNIVVPLTALHLRGTVTNGNQPIEGGTVTLSLTSSETLTTNSEGGFDTVLTFADDVTTLNLTLTATDRLNLQTKTLAVELTPQQITEVSEAIVIRNDQPGTAREYISCTNALAFKDDVFFDADGNGDYGYVKTCNITGQVLWEYYPYVRDDLTVGDTGDVYLGRAWGGLSAFNSTGEVWRFEMEWSPRNIAVAADGTVIMTADKTSALNPDGEELWSFETPTQPTALAVTVDGTVYVGTDKLYALSSTGTLLWSYNTNTIMTTLAIAADGTVYAGLEDAVVAITPDGNEVWRYTANAIRSFAIAEDGTLYVAGDQLYALNPDGTTKWSIVDDAGQYSDLIVSAEGTVYVLHEASDYLKRVKAISEAGTELWSFGKGLQYEDSILLAEDGTLYAGGYVLNAGTTGLAHSSWPSSNGGQQNARRQLLSH